MYDPIEITRLLVFGTNNPSPDDYSGMQTSQVQ